MATFGDSRGKTEPTPELDPDEVGYVKHPPTPPVHDPQTCALAHCSCHLPLSFALRVPGMGLTAQEAFVLTWHVFPIGSRDEDFLTLAECGKKLGVTEERVRQIFTRAKCKLRAHTRTHYPDSPVQAKIKSESDMTREGTERRGHGPVPPRFKKSNPALEPDDFAALDRTQVRGLGNPDVH